MDFFLILSQCNSDFAQPLFEEAVVVGWGVKNYTEHDSKPLTKTTRLIVRVSERVENGHAKLNYECIWWKNQETLLVDFRGK